MSPVPIMVAAEGRGKSKDYEKRKYENNSRDIIYEVAVPNNRQERATRPVNATKPSAFYKHKEPNEKGENFILITQIFRMT